MEVLFLNLFYILYFQQNCNSRVTSELFMQLCATLGMPGHTLQKQMLEIFSSMCLYAYMQKIQETQ